MSLQLSKLILTSGIVMAVGLMAGCGSSGGPDTASTGTSAGTPGIPGSVPTKSATIGHVFIIVLENEDYSDTFATNTLAPYLAEQLPAQGALLKNYYGTGHESNDNYISMISGQAPNLDTQTDCQIYSNFNGTGPNAALGNQAVGQGCVFPTSVPNITDQLTAAKLTWKAYMEDMGNTPSRESATCGHPTLNSQDGTQSATAADNYATRHNPFMYFHSIIDDTATCNANVVALDGILDKDLGSVSTTANYTFITPSLCHDGHDSPCADGEPGGLASINSFLQEWVPKIMASPAYQQDGLLIITFDESSGPQSDSSSCCLAATTLPPNTAMPGLTGKGGGVTGAVLLSPFIKPGTVSTTSYDHYSMLRTVEDAFGLQYLGYAGDSAQASFGPDVFTQQMPVFPTKQ
jgi:hypothetical protein